MKKLLIILTAVIITSCASVKGSPGSNDPCVPYCAKVKVSKG